MKKSNQCALLDRCHYTFHKAHIGPVHVVRYNTDGDYCLSGGEDRFIRLWNSSTGNCIKSYAGHGKPVTAIAVAHDNSTFISCGGDKMVFVWDVATGKTKRRLEGHHHRVNCVDVNKELSLAVSGSFDATVRIWDLRSNSPSIQVLEHAKDSISSLKLSDTDILTGSVDGAIRIYDIRKMQLYTDKIGEPVTSVCYSKDGHCILASTLNDTVWLFDKENGSMLNHYKGHKNNKYKMDSCFSKDDAYIISGSEDTSIYIWDIVTGDNVKQLKGHSRSVTSLAYHPKEERLLSGSVDGSIKDWRPL